MIEDLTSAGRAMSDVDIKVVVAVHEERFRGVDKALTLQAQEYERRLETLNHENARVAHVLDNSVTSDKFDDYVGTQERALRAALVAIEDKTSIFTARTREDVTDLSARIASLEQSSRAHQRISDNDSIDKGRSSDHLNAFLVGGMGVLISVVVIITNLVFAKTP